MVASWLWAQETGRDYGFGVSDMPWMGVLVSVFLMVSFQIPLKLPGLKSPKAGIITLSLLALATLIGLFFIGPIAITLAIASYVGLGVLNLLIKWF